MIRIFSKNIWNCDKEKFEKGVLEISGSKISGYQSGDPDLKKNKQKVLDYGDLFVSPSAVDLHIHSRGFLESHKESFETLEAAALKGGVSAGACMANTFPRLDSPQMIREFFKFSKPLRVKLSPFAAVTKNLEGKNPTDWDELLKMPIAGLSDDGKPLLNEKLFEQALVKTKKYKKFISLHEENTETSCASQLHLSESSMRLGIEGSPENSESEMVARDLAIASRVKAHLHLAHMSSAKSVALIQAAKKKGVSVSAELTPHHALLSVDQAEKYSYVDLSRFKVCPVIRSREDQAALWKGVENGAIDCFASDHAPHSHFEKDRPYKEAAHGMIGLEYYFPLYNEFRLRSKLSWKRFFECFWKNPAKLLKLDMNAADLIIFDPNAVQTLDWSLSKSSNTPFAGAKIRGKIVEHWIAGKKLYGI
ncbi:MAG: dihydroorotase [Deltaproteobacteria bacterium]|nr:dihydroorotase [Deltaproteobacteria bacterium]